MNRISCAFTTCVLAFSAATATHAAVLIEFEERESGVFGEVSGSLNLDAFVPFGTSSFTQDYINPFFGNVSILTGSLSDEYLVWQDTGSLSFGSSMDYAFATSVSGDSFRINPLSAVYVPFGYQSGDAISSFIDFYGASFDSLGINNNVDTTMTYSRTAQDTIRLTTKSLVPQPSPVPLPAGLPLLLAGLSAFGLIRSRG